LLRRGPVSALALASLLSATVLHTQQQPQAKQEADVRPSGSPLVLEANKSGLKMDPGAHEDMVRAMSSSGNPAPLSFRDILAELAKSHYTVVHVEFRNVLARTQFRLAGATVFAQYDRFADLFLSSLASLDAVLRHPDVIWAEESSQLSVPPPPQLSSGAAARAIPEAIVQGGLGRYRGRGVIIAVIDTGIDFRNPDFISFDPMGRPSSRLVYFWDAGAKSYDESRGSAPPLNYPNGTPAGTLYTREQLTADLRALPLLRRIPATDEFGHGTAAASVAASNGNNSKGRIQGVAPEADVIGVSLGPGLEAAYLLNAILEWLDAVARKEKRPLVISCSFGSHGTGHDGASIRERHLSARFQPNTPGRAIVVAAGNEQEEPVHAKAHGRGSNQRAYLSWDADEETYIHLYIQVPKPEAYFTGDLYYEALDMRVTDATQPAGWRWQPTVLQKTLPLTFNPVAREWQFTLRVPRGRGGVSLWSKAGIPFTADAYLVDGSSAGKFLVSLNVGSGPIAVADVEEQVSAPATAANAIAVGSYDWSDQFDGKTFNACGKPILIGALSCYSNLGYNRLYPPPALDSPGYVKPEIVAPGQHYSASYAHLLDGSGVRSKVYRVDSSGKYVLFSGTSAATPYVAGVIALMMEKKPGITVGEIKWMLRKFATQEPDETGPLPNPRWGFGKLDLPAVEAILQNVR
jgi:subtilisin family serine protease